MYATIHDPNYMHKMYSYKYSKLEEMSEFAGFLKYSAWSVSIRTKLITRIRGCIVLRIASHGI